MGRAVPHPGVPSSGGALIRGCSTPALRKRRRENEDEKKNRAFGLDWHTRTVEGEPDNTTKKNLTSAAQRTFDTTAGL